MKSKSLEDAVKRLKDGDKSAFDYIYDSTYKAVYFVAHRILRNDNQAQDITQDAYIAAYKSLESYRSDNFFAYLTTIAKRLAINEYHKNKRSVSVDFSEWGDKIGGGARMPDDESIGLIKLAEELLEDQDFEIVTLYAISGYKRREIAKLLNLPISTVSYRYDRAIKILEKALKGGR